MLRLVRSLRFRAADHRDVFAEFAVALVFIFAEQMAARRGQARMRVVR